MGASDFQPAPNLRVRLDPDAGRAGELRARLRSWLGGAGATQDEIFDVSVACSEAFANAIEHPLDADGHAVEVEGVVSNGEVILTIRDRGAWREHRLRQEGGLGLPLMRSLMGSVEVERGPGGTTVVLRRCLRSPLAA